MSPLTQCVAGAVGSMLHRPRPAGECAYARHPFPLGAVDRHGHGVFTCPGCHASIKPFRERDGKVFIPSHTRLPAVTTEAVGR